MTADKNYDSRGSPLLTARGGGDSNWQNYMFVPGANMQQQQQLQLNGGGCGAGGGLDTCSTTGMQLMAAAGSLGLSTGSLGAPGASAGNMHMDGSSDNHVGMMRGLDGHTFGGGGSGATTFVPLAGFTAGSTSAAPPARFRAGATAPIGPQIGGGTMDASSLQCMDAPPAAPGLPTSHFSSPLTGLGTAFMPGASQHPTGMNNNARTSTKTSSSAAVEQQNLNRMPTGGSAQLHSSSGPWAMMTDPGTKAGGAQSHSFSVCGTDRSHNMNDYRGPLAPSSNRAEEVPREGNKDKPQRHTAPPPLPPAPPRIDYGRVRGNSTTQQQQQRDLDRRDGHVKLQHHLIQIPSPLSMRKDALPAPPAPEPLQGARAPGGSKGHASGSLGGTATSAGAGGSGKGGYQQQWPQANSKNGPGTTGTGNIKGSVHGSGPGSWYHPDNRFATSGTTGGKDQHRDHHLDGKNKGGAKNATGHSNGTNTKGAWCSTTTTPRTKGSAAGTTGTGGGSAPDGYGLRFGGSLSQNWRDRSSNLQVKQDQQDRSKGGGKMNEGGPPRSSAAPDSLAADSHFHCPAPKMFTPNPPRRNSPKKFSSCSSSSARAEDQHSNTSHKPAGTREQGARAAFVKWRDANRHLEENYPAQPVPSRHWSPPPVPSHPSLNLESSACPSEDLSSNHFSNGSEGTGGSLSGTWRLTGSATRSGNAAARAALREQQENDKAAYKGAGPPSSPSRRNTSSSGRVAQTSSSPQAKEAVKPAETSKERPGPQAQPHCPSAFDADEGAAQTQNFVAEESAPALSAVRVNGNANECSKPNLANEKSEDHDVDAAAAVVIADAPADRGPGHEKLLDSVDDPATPNTLPQRHSAVFTSEMERDFHSSGEGQYCSDTDQFCRSFSDNCAVPTSANASYKKYQLGGAQLHAQDLPSLLSLEVTRNESKLAEVDGKAASTSSTAEEREEDESTPYLDTTEHAIIGGEDEETSNASSFGDGKPVGLGALLSEDEDRERDQNDEQEVRGASAKPPHVAAVGRCSNPFAALGTSSDDEMESDDEEQEDQADVEDASTDKNMDHAHADQDHEHDHDEFEGGDADSESPTNFAAEHHDPAMQYYSMPPSEADVGMLAESESWSTPLVCAIPAATETETRPHPAADDDEVEDRGAPAKVADGHDDVEFLSQEEEEKEGWAVVSLRSPEDEEAEAQEVAGAVAEQLEVGVEQEAKPCKKEERGEELQAVAVDVQLLVDEKSVDLEKENDEQTQQSGKQNELEVREDHDQDVEVVVPEVITAPSAAPPSPTETSNEKVVELHLLEVDQDVPLHAAVALAKAKAANVEASQRKSDSIAPEDPGPDEKPTAPMSTSIPPLSPLAEPDEAGARAAEAATALKAKEKCCDLENVDRLRDSAADGGHITRSPVPPYGNESDTHDVSMEDARAIVGKLTSEIKRELDDLEDEIKMEMADGGSISSVPESAPLVPDAGVPKPFAATGGATTSSASHVKVEEQKHDQCVVPEPPQSKGEPSSIRMEAALEQDKDDKKIQTSTEDGELEAPPNARSPLRTQDDPRQTSRATSTTPFPGDCAGPAAGRPSTSATATGVATTGGAEVDYFEYRGDHSDRIAANFCSDEDEYETSSNLPPSSSCSAPAAGSSGASECGTARESCAASDSEATGARRIPRGFSAGLPPTVFAPPSGSISTSSRNLGAPVVSGAGSELGVDAGGGEENGNADNTISDEVPRLCEELSRRMAAMADPAAAEGDKQQDNEQEDEGREDFSPMVQASQPGAPTQAATEQPQSAGEDASRLAAAVLQDEQFLQDRADTVNDSQALTLSEAAERRREMGVVELGQGQEVRDPFADEAEQPQPNEGLSPPFGDEVVEEREQFLQARADATGSDPDPQVARVRKRSFSVSPRELNALVKLAQDPSAQLGQGQEVLDSFADEVEQKPQPSEGLSSTFGGAVEEREQFVQDRADAPGSDPDPQVARVRKRSFSVSPRELKALVKLAQDPSALNEGSCADSHSDSAESNTISEQIPVPSPRFGTNADEADEFPSMNGATPASSTVNDCDDSVDGQDHVAEADVGVTVPVPVVKQHARYVQSAHAHEESHQHQKHHHEGAGVSGENAELLVATSDLAATSASPHCHIPGPPAPAAASTAEAAVAAAFAVSPSHASTSVYDRQYLEAELRRAAVAFAQHGDAAMARENVVDDGLATSAYHCDAGGAGAGAAAVPVGHLDLQRHVEADALLEGASRCTSSVTFADPAAFEAHNQNLRLAGADSWDAGRAGRKNSASTLQDYDASANSSSPSDVVAQFADLDLSHSSPHVGTSRVPTPVPRNPAALSAPALGGAAAELWAAEGEAATTSSAMSRQSDTQVAKAAPGEMLYSSNRVPPPAAPLQEAAFHQYEHPSMHVPYYPAGARAPAPPTYPAHVAPAAGHLYEHYGGGGAAGGTPAFGSPLLQKKQRPPTPAQTDFDIPLSATTKLASVVEQGGSSGGSPETERTMCESIPAAPERAQDAVSARKPISTDHKNSGVPFGSTQQPQPTPSSNAASAVSTSASSPTGMSTRSSKGHASSTTATSLSVSDQTSQTSSSTSADAGSRRGHEMTPGTTSAADHPDVPTLAEVVAKTAAKTAKDGKDAPLTAWERAAANALLYIGHHSQPPPQPSSASTPTTRPAVREGFLNPKASQEQARYALNYLGSHAYELYGPQMEQRSVANDFLFLAPPKAKKKINPPPAQREQTFQDRWCSTGGLFDKLLGASEADQKSKSATRNRAKPEEEAGYCPQQ